MLWGDREEREFASTKLPVRKRQVQCKQCGGPVVEYYIPGGLIGHPDEEIIKRIPGRLVQRDCPGIQIKRFPWGEYEITIFRFCGSGVSSVIEDHTISAKEFPTHCPICGRPLDQHGLKQVGENVWEAFLPVRWVEPVEGCPACYYYKEKEED